jgi:hypothetical protein
MERSINSFRFESESNALPETHESSKCDTCGEEFEAPLNAVISSGYLREEYLACPRCLAKVRTVDRQKHVEPEETEEEEAEEPEVMEVKEKVEMEETVVCPHHMGYLKRRPKNSPIPEECLTCTKMIDCMSY